jgi:hypothetical protein
LKEEPAVCQAVLETSHIGVHVQFNILRSGYGNTHQLSCWYWPSRRPRLHFSHNPVRRAALTVACGRCMYMTFCVSIKADTRFFWLDFHRLVSWGAAPGCPCVLDKYAITPTALSSAESCGRPLRRWWKGNCTLHCASCGSHALKRGWYWHRSFP